MSYKDRNFFWDELAGLQVICGEKWVLGGDFNVVRFTHERSHPPRSTRTLDCSTDLFRKEI